MPAPHLGRGFVEPKWCVWRFCVGGESKQAPRQQRGAWFFAVRVRAVFSRFGVRLGVRAEVAGLGQRFLVYRGEIGPCSISSFVWGMGERQEAPWRRFHALPYA